MLGRFEECSIIHSKQRDKAVDHGLFLCANDCPSGPRSTMLFPEETITALLELNFMHTGVSLKLPRSSLPYRGSATRIRERVTIGMFYGVDTLDITLGKSMPVFTSLFNHPATS